MTTEQLKEPRTAVGTPPWEDYVLVGDDGTRYSRAAVDFAVEEASRRRLPLSVVTIRRSLMVPGVSLTDQLREERSAVREAEHRLRSSLARARERHPDVAVDGVLLKDPEPTQVAERLAGAALLVLGTHSAIGLPAFSVDSTSMELTEIASCPVVCVPDAATPSVSGGDGESLPVVVGVDTGIFATRLLQQAGEEARRRSTRLVVVHGYRVQPGEEPAHVEACARAAVQELLRRAGLYPRIDVSIDLAPAPAAVALADWSRRACLLVTGSRGLLALAGLTRDSVSRAVLDSALCPVLVVLERVRQAVHA